MFQIKLLTFRHLAPVTQMNKSPIKLTMFNRRLNEFELDELMSVFDFRELSIIQNTPFCVFFLKLTSINITYIRYLKANIYIIIINNCYIIYLCLF